MSHVYKVSEWQGASGKWYCNDTSDLAGIAGKWWIPARLLKMSLEEYIFLLKDSFHATIESYNDKTDVLIYYWDKYADCHKYLLWINSMSRKINFIV